jgi:hypothetical protein
MSQPEKKQGKQQERKAPGKPQGKGEASSKPQEGSEQQVEKKGAPRKGGGKQRN